MSPTARCFVEKDLTSASSSLCFKPIVTFSTKMNFADSIDSIATQMDTLQLKAGSDISTVSSSAVSDKLSAMVIYSCDKSDISVTVNPGNSDVQYQQDLLDSNAPSAIANSSRRHRHTADNEPAAIEFIRIVDSISSNERNKRHQRKRKTGVDNGALDRILAAMTNSQQQQQASPRAKRRLRSTRGQSTDSVAVSKPDDSKRRRPNRTDEGDADIDLLIGDIASLAAYDDVSGPKKTVRCRDCLRVFQSRDARKIHHS